MIRAVFLLALAACSAASADPAPAAATVSDSGAVLYKRLCAACHGATGAGYTSDHAPSLISPTFLGTATDEFLRRSIVLGRPGTAMAGYGAAIGGPLDDAAADRLTAFIRAWGPPPTVLPRITTGDATRGAAIYAASCQRCHGDAKQRGEAVHLANPRFLELASDEFIRAAVVDGRPGTPMISWRGILTDAQIDDVVAAVRALGTPAPDAEQRLPPPTGKEPVVLNPRGAAPKFTMTEDRYVTAAQVADALAKHRKLIILDARPASDWMRVHVTGAVSLPYHDLAAIDRLPNDGTWIIAYCACPHHLSGLLVDELRTRKFTHTAVLDEGILDWHRRGFPVVAAPGVKPPPAEAPPP